VEPQGGSARFTDRVAPLDGVRGIAILAIMAFHSGVSGLDVGGYFGVDAFFVLSGFLITLILLQEWNRSQAIRLGRFYAGRARRLIPGLLVMLISVALFVVFVAPAGQYPGFRDDALSVLGYFSNWHFLSTGANYFARTAAPSLLTHTWSLAIEEQFYLVWPPIVVAVLWLTRLQRTRGLTVLLCLSLSGVLASCGWMTLLYRAGASQTRLYYGTDTHAQSILVGCGLAVVLTMIKERRGLNSLVPVAQSAKVRQTLSIVGVVAAFGLAWQWTHVGNSDPFAYQGGYLLGALLTALVLASVSCAPSGPLAVVLSMRWIRYVGTISYGMYLWYFPVFQYVDGSRTGQTGLSLFGIRVGVDMAIATCSFFLIERPVRLGTFFRLQGTDRVLQWRSLGVLFMAVTATVVVVAVTTTGTSAPIRDPVALAAAASPPGTFTLTPHRETTASAATPVTSVLIVGDSTALTLGFGLPPSGSGWHAAIDNVGVEACGLAIGSVVRDNGVVGPYGPPCESSTPVSEQWPAKLSGYVASDKPDVVALLAGRWEVVDTLYDGRWTNILDPAFRGYIEQQLRLAVQIGTSSGAHMVLLTAPCYSSGEQPDGTPWPEDSVARLTAYNDLLYQVAAEDQSRVSVVDLNAIVCPGGTFHSTLDGVTIRAPDGIHFPFYIFGAQAAGPNTAAQVESFGKWIGPRLMPSLVAGAKAPRL
jgi:peptidoglycan/LPS O-acetylase OafA/YrhL